MPQTQPLENKTEEQKAESKSWGALYEEKLRKRVLINEQCRNDLLFRQVVLETCKEDFEFWCDNFAWTFDPRSEQAQKPFILYEKQRIYAKWTIGLIDNGENGFVDKSRDVGATVTTMNILLWYWLFREGFSARVGSRKEDYVDKQQDRDTLFAKADYTLDRLPEWMVPSGYNAQKHRNRMLLYNPEKQSTISGESSNSNFARGGRQKVVYFDELGFWAEARSAWQSAGDVTKTRLGMSTPPQENEPGYSFLYKLKSGQEGAVKKLEFDYFDVPWKDEVWNKEQQMNRSKEEYEREVLRSYGGTGEGKVYQKEFETNVVYDYTLEYNPKLPLFVAWDFGLDGTAMNWFQIDFNISKVYWIDSYEHADKIIDFFIPFVTGVIVSGEYEYTDEEVEMIARHGKWSKTVTHFGDPDVAKKSYISGDSKGDPTSTREILTKNGIYVQSKAHPGHYQMKQITTLLFRRLIVNPDRCAHAVDCILSSTYPKRRDNSMSTVGVSAPIHNWTSHHRSCVEYFAHNEPQMNFAERTKRKVLKRGR